jgi:hypothetical protein
MTKEIEHAIVRIQRDTGQIFGAGFAVCCNQVLSCAHVVADMLDIPRESAELPKKVVYLDFPLLETGVSKQLSATVKYWNVDLDIALLEILEDFPENVRPIDLQVLDEYAKHEFHVCGFPVNKDGGTWASGIMLGKVGEGYIEVEAGTAHRIQGGFSGGPVWNLTKGLLAGIVVASDEGKPGDKIAYIIPVATLLQVLPELAKMQQVQRPFRHACFISFPIPKNTLIRPAVVEIREDLLAEINAQISDRDVYVDEGRLVDVYDDSIVTALCESACMVMIYTQRYFGKADEHCAREYRAMEILEEARLKAIETEPCQEHSLIVPVVLRGANSFPRGIMAHRRIYNFERYYLMESRARRKSRDYLRDIKEIAEHVVQHCMILEERLQNPCGHCDDFLLPSVEEIRDMLTAWKPSYVL